MRGRLVLAIALLAQVGSVRFAHAAPGVETVTVTASALPDGAGATPPVGIQSLSSADISRFGAPDLLGAMQRDLAGVSFAEAQDNPFQPNLLYHGFEASPLVGDAQGLAVYADGVRMNQAFGDTVEWSLIPDIALSQVSLEGSNPVFGLNALGGSLSLRFKNGFAFQGAEAEASAGAFASWQGAFQYGALDGDQAFYAAGNVYGESGWRKNSPSRLAQFFANYSWHGSRAGLHLDVLGAATNLTGNGASPVQLLAADRAAVFTWPDNSKDTFGLANLFGTYLLTNSLSLSGNLYVNDLLRKTLNGDASDASPCGAFLCLDDGSLVTDMSGAPIPNFLHGAPYAQLNRTSTRTLGTGGTVQANDRERWFGMKERFLAGIAFDEAHTDFAADSAIGALTLSRGFGGPGIVIDQADNSIAPVKVASDNDYYGFYAAASTDLTDALTLDLSGRYNIAHIALHDRLGTALNGSHAYAHFNPAAGLTYRFAPDIAVFADYATANRAPTPAEFSCADPKAPCSLTNFFTGDPDLKQVVSHTLQFGLRGTRPAGRGTLNWQIEAYRTDTDDDIMFSASTIIGRAFFQNIGSTRRQGLDAGISYTAEGWFVQAAYSYTDATFRNALTLSSEDNPFADANGDIHVAPGDHLPSIPAHQLKATVGWQPASGWTLTLSALFSSGVWLQGDESNLDRRTGSYAVFDAGVRCRATDWAELFLTADNLFNAKYATFGTFSPTGDVPMREAPGAANPRSLSPGAPRTVFGGIRATF